MLQDSCIQSQPLRGCTALHSVFTSSLLDRYCLGNFSFCTISQLTSSSLLVVCSTPSPTLLLSKMLFLLASVRQLVLRNQKSYNYSIPHSNAWNTGGSVGQWRRGYRMWPWGLVLTTLLVRPLSTYFKFSNLNCTAHKKSTKQHNLLYIWGK